MSDPSPGQPTGVRQTPIRIDERGRRVRDDGVPEAFPAALKAGGAAEAGGADVGARLDAYIAENDSRIVTGPGFSGNLGQGLKWNPNQTGATGPGAGDSNAGTDNNPFIMPQGTGLTAETTTWNIEDPPLDGMGDPTDGVELFSPIRYFISATPDTTQVVTTPGGTVTINSFIVWTFVRPLTWDNLGALVAIGAEDRLDASVSPVQITFS